MRDKELVNCSSTSDLDERRRFQKSSRLLDSLAYQNVFAANKSFHHQGFTILARKSAGTSPRLGLAISKKQIRRAVDRNKVKRIVRETFRLGIEKNLPVDLVVLAKSRVLQLDNKKMITTLEQQWCKVNHYFSNSQ